MEWVKHPRISPWWIWTIVLWGVFVTTPAGSQAAEVSLSGELAEQGSAVPVRTFGNLRIGASSGNDNRRPQLCLELEPVDRFGVEACGTGAGFLHTDPAPELAHFRMKWRVFQNGWTLGNGVWLAPYIGAGLAELQIGADAPGFKVGTTNPDGVETAGPETSFDLRAAWPLAAGIDLVADANVGLAWLPAAERLATPYAPLQPFAGFSVGVGY